MNWFSGNNRAAHVIAVTVAIRLVWMVLVLLFQPDDGFFMYDSSLYSHFADTLLEHGRYAYHNQGIFYPVHSHTPGFPFFIAFFKGLGWYPGGLVVFQILCTGLTAFFTLKVADHWFKDQSIGVWAALLLAMDIPSIVFSNMVMTETLYTTGFMASLYFMLRFFVEKRSFLLFFAGLLLGGAILLRAVGLLLPFLFLIWLMMHRKQIPALSKAMALFIVALSLPTGMWMVRNYAVFDSVFITTLGNTNLFYYRAAGVIAQKQQISLYEARAHIEKDHPKIEPNGDNRALIAFSKHIRNAGFRVLAEHPDIAFRNHLAAVLRLLGQPMRVPLEMQLGYREKAEALPGGKAVKGENMFNKFWHTTSWPTRIAVLFQMFFMGIIWLFFFKGSWVLWQKKQRWPIGIVGSIIAYYCLVAAGPETDARFRITIMPVILVLAAYGLHLQKKQRQ